MAWLKYILIIFIGYKLLINSSVQAVINNLKVFGVLDPEQMSSVHYIVESFKKYGDGDRNKLAYIFATAWHESRLRPIKEIRATTGPVVARQNKYWGTGYYGRGFVQLTHKVNYLKMSQLLGIDLVNHPDKALDSEIASKILVIGMMDGMFTGIKLGDYINKQKVDFFTARRVVNGYDRAQLIAGYAEKLT